MPVQMGLPNVVVLITGLRALAWDYTEWGGGRDIPSTSLQHLTSLTQAPIK